MAAEVLTETKISDGYLTVVPKSVRELLDAHEGDLVQWNLKGNAIWIRIRKRKTIHDIVGLISHGGNAVESKKAAQGMRLRVH